MAGSKGSAHALGDAIDAAIRSYFRREPKQSRSRALVEAVVAATDELLRRGEPIEEVSVERVSERAGIGMGSFYEYFASKDSVLGVLIGKVTRSNFDELARELAALELESLDELTYAFNRRVAEIYLAHPNRTRVIIEAVGRLGLGRLVIDEKDRFAHLMAVRAAPFLPGEPLDAIVATMRLLTDAGMGVLMFTAARGGAIDVEQIAEHLAGQSMAAIRRRHPHAAPPPSR